MDETDHSEPSGRTVFATTRWTLVMRARGDAPAARAALGELCEAYWNPVFRFLRREGRSEDASRELTQEFFTLLLAHGGIDEVSPDKGRFRSYILGALKHFLANRKRDQGRQKRGGDAIVQSIDSDGGSETSPGMQIADAAATVPDAFFDHQWALAVMERALDTVRSGFSASGKEGYFDVLKPWLTGDGGDSSQADAAAQLGTSAGAVRVAIHRLRKDFGEAVRAEISQTVDSPAEVAEELRYLIEVLAG